LSFAAVARVIGVLGERPPANVFVADDWGELDCGEVSDFFGIFSVRPVIRLSSFSLSDSLFNCVMFVELVADSSVS
jgi:hypothetical protein